MNRAPPSHPFVYLDVIAYASVRDAQGRLLRSDERSIVVAKMCDLSAAILDLVREYWPEATSTDIAWNTTLPEWDGSAPLVWTTCAEVDGIVQYRLH